MDASAIGVKLGFEVLRRTAPAGLAWLTTHIRGIELLIVGPAAAGKTSIAEYLQYGVLEDSQAHEKTLEIHKSSTFAIAVGRDEALKLRIRRAVDVPGQTGPVQHANLVRERRPHALLVVLDASRPGAETVDWLEPFCERLDYVLRKDKRLEKKIRGFFFALNKRDIIRRKTGFESRQRKVRQSISERLGELLGRQAVKAIPVLPTVAVKTKYGTNMIDALIRKIAKQVAK